MNPVVRCLATLTIAYAILGAIAAPAAQTSSPHDFDRQLDSLPLIDEINQYLHNAGGKRLRPTVLMLCARMLGQGGEAAVKLGGVVELLGAMDVRRQS